MLFLTFFFLFICIKAEVAFFLDKIRNPLDLKESLSPLSNICLNASSLEYAFESSSDPSHIIDEDPRSIILLKSISICFSDAIYQIVRFQNDQKQTDEYTETIGFYSSFESSPDFQIYRLVESENNNQDFSSSILDSKESTPNYLSSECNRLNFRNNFKRKYSEVNIQCCSNLADRKNLKYSSQIYLKSKIDTSKNAGVIDDLMNTYLYSGEESIPCSYYYTICSPLACHQRASNEQYELSETIKDELDEIEDSMKSLENVIPVVHLEDEISSSLNNDQEITYTEFESEKEIDIDVDGNVQLEEPQTDQYLYKSMGLPEFRDDRFDGRMQKDLLARAKKAFTHAYDSYMIHAFPEAELRPLTCEGGKFDLIKIPLVSLIDALDTLVIVGNYSEFRKAVNIVVTQMHDFDFDVNVSVFETTIRLLGGLLSAHMMAIDPSLDIYNATRYYEEGEEMYQYSNQLLALAIDLGERLLPAFNTKTGIPYGTVNLRKGVPVGETKISSTAGAGSLLLEFQILSYLSGIEKFGKAAFDATEALFQRKSKIGLFGKHINIETGQWHEAVSGVGSNSDSFYEYLLKSFLLFRQKELFDMFSEAYRAIHEFIVVESKGKWFVEVDMFSGKLQRKRTENLDAFWPGLESMLGRTKHGTEILNSFYGVWSDLKFLPEEFDFNDWKSDIKASSGMLPRPYFYLLRPELIESTYHHYRTTGDKSWLRAGQLFLESIENYTRTDCGYATVSDIKKMELANEMPSFFLSETCKYLILLFDEDNFINHRPYVFSTEAHPFDSLQLYELYKNSSPSYKAELSHKSSSFNKSVNLKKIIENDGPIYNSPISVPRLVSKRRHLLTTKEAHINQGVSRDDKVNTAYSSLNEAPPSTSHIPLKCTKPNWLDPSVSYDSNYLQDFELKDTYQELEASLNYLSHAPEDHYQQALKIFQKLFSKASPNSILGQLKDKLDPQGTKDQFTADIEEKFFPMSTKFFSLFESIAQYFIAVDKLQALPEKESIPLERYFSINDKQESLPPKCQRKPRSSNQNGNSQTSSKQSEPNTTPEDVTFIKSADLNHNELGDFTIKFYSNNFKVISHRYKNSIDINNIGSMVVMIQETYAPTKPMSEKTDPSSSLVDKQEKMNSGIIIGNSTGNVISCNVRLNIFLPNGARQSVWNRHCSVGNFGKIFSDTKVEAVLFYPEENRKHHDNFLCKDIRWSLESANNPGNRGNDREIYKKDEKNSWWPWLTHHLSIYHSKPEDKEKRMTHLAKKEKDLMEPKEAILANSAEEVAVADSVVADKEFADESLDVILLADRGKCLFEEKMEVTKALGAKASIVRNNEEFLIIMAGRNEANTQTTTGSSSASSSQSSKSETKKRRKVCTISPKIKKMAPRGRPLQVKTSPSTEQTSQFVVKETVEEHGQPIDPPTPLVMLSKSDSDDLLALWDKFSSPDSGHFYEPKVEIDVHVTELFLASEHWGDFTYPKILKNTEQILVYSSANWGTVLTASPSNEWKLYILPKWNFYQDEVKYAFPILSRSGQIKFTNILMNRNGIQMYHDTIYRKCPNKIRVDLKKNVNPINLEERHSPDTAEQLFANARIKLI